MQSIRDIFVIGNGPSSSHTMAPSFACDYVIKKYKRIKRVEVILYGSLALTGRGHLTDYIINKKFNEAGIKSEVKFDYHFDCVHPNTMEFVIFTQRKIHNEKIISTGGGSFLVLNEKEKKKPEIYKYSLLSDIIKDANKKKLSLFEYALKYEGKDILNYLGCVLDTMEECAKNGLKAYGVLPGSLKVERKAKEILKRVSTESNPFIKKQLIIMAYSYAVSEENASGAIVSTAPTCGSCGVLPGVIAFLKENSVSREKIIESLLVAGLIGKIVKTNATVSGAVAGCQAEIGTATAMGAAMIMNAFCLSNEKIAQASEIALEHSLGLTCDPIHGYVQIPCIERNAVFSLKAVNSASLAMSISSDNSKIGFDDIVHTMYETGLDLQQGYRETSEKGMSKIRL